VRLNQIYSLRYGTLPLVRATGGLEDTVQQYDEASGRGPASSSGAERQRPVLHGGLGGEHLLRPPAAHPGMVHAAMAQDYSWDRSARVYEAAYLRARKKG